MANRKDFYFRQLVNEAFMDAAFDDLENADRNLAVDISVIGIISGLVATQHSPTPDLTIDLTGPGTAYDQAGRRMFVPTATSGLDCSQDEDGNPTAVVGGGNERWCSVQLRFDRTLANPEVDGNGNTVYTDQDESFELAVVRAGEFATGTNTKPALPADGRLVCDFRLVFGTTQILNAEIYIDRRQDFQIYSAGQIPVSSGGWSFLNGAATNDVQAVLDFIDARILYLDGSREMSENLIPNAAARDLGEVGKEWDLFLEKLTPSATARVNGDLIPQTTGKDLGTTSLRWSLYADLLNLDGNLVTSASSRVLGNLIPSAGTEVLGTTGATNQWAQVHAAIATIYTSILANVDGLAIGAAGARFNAFLNAITHYGTLTGSFQFDAAESVTVEIPIMDSWVPQDVDWTANSTRTWIQSTLANKFVHLYFRPLHGIEIDQMRIRWAQASSTGMAAQIEKTDEDNAATSIGASKQITTIDGSTNWDTIASGIGETVDLNTYAYRVKVTTAVAVVHQVFRLEITYKVTDILKAALGNV
jgi:hypothetical protein